MRVDSPKFEPRKLVQVAKFQVAQTTVQEVPTWKIKFKDQPMEANSLLSKAANASSGINPE
jgi:hypothetical protein